MSRWLRLSEVAGLTGIIAGHGDTRRGRQGAAGVPRDLILQFHAAIAAAAQRQLHDRANADDDVRRLWEIVDLVLGSRARLIALRSRHRSRRIRCDRRIRLSRLAPAQRRVRAIAVDSAFVRGLYDLAFAYEDGDVARPRIAAGQALRGAVRAFFTYRGAFFWKMQAGMGDVVFAPLYEVLATARSALRVLPSRSTCARDGRRLAEAIGRTSTDLRLRRAGDVGGGPVRAARRRQGLPCWPSSRTTPSSSTVSGFAREGRDFESHWDRRTAARRRCAVGGDFDFVVLARRARRRAARLPGSSSHARRAGARWSSTCKSVPTQALQLWLDRRHDGAGLDNGRVNLSGFVEPFDTWADMSQLVRRRPLERPSAAIAYFCSVLPDAPPG